MLYFPRWKIALILIVVAAGMFFAAPNLMSRDKAESFPDWWQPVNLGLDLQGGSHLLLEVDVDQVVHDLVDSLVDSVRVTLRRERIRYTGLSSSGLEVRVQISDPDQVQDAVRALRRIADEVNVSTGRDGQLTLRYSDSALNERRAQAIEQSIEIVRRRIDETGTREPTIQRQGEDRIIVELPGVDDPERVKALLGQTARLTFHLVNFNVTPEDVAAGRIPPGTMLVPTQDTAFQEYGNRLPVRQRVAVGGDRLTDAQTAFQDGQPVVTFRFDTLGARQFGQLTQENVGQNLAILLDNEVISAPTIREPILGGSGQISGRFTVEEANDLALLLRAGALPAPLTVLEERTVGPGLGADSIAAGQVASVLGMILVVLFMLFNYRFFGIIANTALAVNLVLLLAALSALGATLTLPGIAGIVLTIGMAVDANVLIFERIREEVRNGRTIVSAIENGFGRAFTAILDSNITTLVAAALLFQFGSGPVRGFAVTLGLGIITSMFTAIMVTRMMVVLWMRMRKPQALPI